MRFMILIKADDNTEAGVMLAGEGLHPSAKGARVHFSNGRRAVLDGPFVDTRGLICGFWLWQCESLQQAIEWVKRCPDPLKGDAEIEIRQIYEAEDFGAALTPELREQEENLRAEIRRLATSAQS